MKYVALIVLSLFISGCASDLTVESTKQWEGHYYSYVEFTNSTYKISLEKNESIWVLSNNTLKRLLKNTEK